VGTGRRAGWLLKFAPTNSDPIFFGQSILEGGLAIQAVIRKLDAVLKPLGFTRQKTTWNRTVGLVVDVVDVQVRKSGDTFTLNAGVLDRGVHVTLWGEEPPSFVEEPSCTVRARIGELIEGTDRWWPVDSPSSLADVASAVESRVLPFLESVHARQAMEDWLEKAQVARKKYPPPILSLVILKSELGRKEEACALLASVRSKVTGAWRARFDDVGARLGCQPVQEMGSVRRDAGEE
jgi:hypothetical protein